MKTFFPVLFAVSCLVSGYSFAHGMDHDHGACKADYKKMCDGKKDADGMKCMDEHEADLSAPCKEEHAKMKAAHEEMKKACQSDMDTLCKDVKADDHKAMHECMMKAQKENKLSDSCKAAHAKMMGEHHGDHHKMDKDAKDKDAKKDSK